MLAADRRRAAGRSASRRPSPVNLDRGGNAGQITVISALRLRGPAQRSSSGRTCSAGSTPSRRRRTPRPRSAARRARWATSAARRPRGSGPWSSAISVVVPLLLMVMLRTVVLPLVAVAFDLLTAAATFGILSLLFVGDNPPLGGLGYLDPMTIIAVVRGGLRHHDRLRGAAARPHAGGVPGDAATRTARCAPGCAQTAAASTGAAIAMVAAIVPFALSDLIVVRELGVAMAVAILLDALHRPARAAARGGRGARALRAGGRPRGTRRRRPGTPPRPRSRRRSCRAAPLAGAPS